MVAGVTCKLRALSREKGQRCVVILSNDVRAEADFADLVKFILAVEERWQPLRAPANSTPSYNVPGYQSAMIRKTGHKLTFDLYDEFSASYVQKYYSYAEADVAAELHRQHCYRVRFNDDPKHPVILEIVEEIEPKTLETKATASDTANG